jgi:hypothetical protein
MYGIDEPESINSFEIIGHPKVPPIHKNIPQIVHSHSIAHPLMSFKATNDAFSLPKYLLLVRDIRSTLESHYARDKKFYGDTSFSDFLRGDKKGGKFHKDIWWDIRFLNSWSRVIKADPGRVCVVRYEDLQADVASEVEKICTFFEIEASRESIDYAINGSTKDKMNDKKGYGWVSIIRMNQVNVYEKYNDGDRTFIEQTLHKNLVDDFGYDYSKWD